MENKDSHIDQFFADKLHNLQGMPSDRAEHHIFRHLDQTNHPIDFALNKALSGNETETEPFESIEHLTKGKSEIDLSLYQRLRDYESEPDRAFTLEQKRKKRPVFWLWFSAIGVLILTGIYALNPSRDNQIAPYNTNKTEYTNPSIANKKEHSTFQFPESTEKRPLIPRAKRMNKSLSMIKTNIIISSLADVQVAFNNETKDIGEDIRHLGLKSISPKIWQLETDINTIDKNNTFHWDPLYKRFPLSFHLQTAYIRETSVSNQIESSNQHKDATDLFSRSTGKRKAGFMISFSAEHNLGKNLKISTGINYSSSSASNQIDYYYTDVPVYDTTGVLRGYLLRSRATSNHTEKQVVSNSSSISIPVNIQYRIIPSKKLNIWMGIGCQIALRRTASGEYFNFKTEQVSTVRQTFSKGLLPQMQLGLRYPINMRWQLSSQIQVARQSLRYQIYDAEYRRVELIPSFNIGLLYTPFIRIK